MEKSLKQARKLVWEPHCSAVGPKALETKSMGASPATSPETPKPCPEQGHCSVRAGQETAGLGSRDGIWLGATPAAS